MRYLQSIQIVDVITRQTLYCTYIYTYKSTYNLEPEIIIISLNSECVGGGVLIRIA